MPIDQFPGSAIIDGTVEAVELSANVNNKINNAYAAANNAFPMMNIVTGTSVTAVIRNHYVITNSAQTSITLPAAPTSGDVIWISSDNLLTNNTILRNGNKIKSLAENMLIDIANVTVQLRYVDANVGWTIT